MGVVKSRTSKNIEDVCQGSTEPEFRSLGIESLNLVFFHNVSESSVTFACTSIDLEHILELFVITIFTFG